MIELSGPSKYLSSNKNPSKLVIFLHGVGSDGLDLIDLAYDINDVLPDAIFLSPNAPFPYESYTSGYQWFSLSDRSNQALYSGIKIALPILKHYIDVNLSHYNLSYKDLLLIGFSQGAMMALQIALALPSQAFAVISFSGAFITPDNLAKEAKCKTAICLIHGDQDQVVPYAQHGLSIKALRALNLPLEEHLIKGLGHSINKEALNFAKDFLTSLDLP